MLLLLDNVAHYFVDRNTDPAGSTGPADHSVRVLYWRKGFDFEDHCVDVVLPLLASPAAVAEAATSPLRFGPYRRTARCRHHRNGFDLKYPHCVRRCQAAAHCYFDIPAEAHVESYLGALQLDLWSRSRSLQREILGKIRKRTGGLDGTVLIGRRIATAERMP